MHGKSWKKPTCSPLPVFLLHGMCFEIVLIFLLCIRETDFMAFSWMHITVLFNHIHLLFIYLVCHPCFLARLPFSISSSTSFFSSHMKTHILKSRFYTWVKLPYLSDLWLILLNMICRSTHFLTCLFFPICSAPNEV